MHYGFDAMVDVEWNWSELKVAWESVGVTW